MQNFGEGLRMECMIIAIDGHAASGKGTIARRLAKILKFDYLDTGTLYRAVAAHVLQEEIELSHVDAILRLIVSIDFSNISSLNLHGVVVSRFVPLVAAIPSVREALFKIQRDFPNNKIGVVVEGRDIGTVIFPETKFKFLITANLEVRTRRRFKQLQSSGENIIYDEVLHDLKERDLQDSNRKIAPLRLDAPYNFIDTSNITLGDSVEKILDIIQAIQSYRSL